MIKSDPVYVVCICFQGNLAWYILHFWPDLFGFRSQPYHCKYHPLVVYGVVVVYVLLTVWYRHITINSIKNTVIIFCLDMFCIDVFIDKWFQIYLLVSSCTCILRVASQLHRLQAITDIALGICQSDDLDWQTLCLLSDQPRSLSVGIVNPHHWRLVLSSFVLTHVWWSRWSPYHHCWCHRHIVPDHCCHYIHRDKWSLAFLVALDAHQFVWLCQ